MIFPRTRSLALAALLAPLFASAALAAQDAAPEDTAETAPAGQDGGKDEAKDAVLETKAEDERICRHVRLDMSSRRKTKVCRTVEEWRELNNIR